MRTLGMIQVGQGHRDVTLHRGGSYPACPFGRERSRQRFEGSFSTKGIFLLGLLNMAVGILN